MGERQTEVQGDILIVDDTPANLRLLSQMLSEHGHTVRAAASGPRALESVEAVVPDLILLDIRMPGMDGYEVCHRLKADDRTRDIPVIFISALDEAQDKVAAFDAGGVDYITKPFHLQEVVARVRTHLSLRYLQKQLQEVDRKLRQEMALAGEIQASFLPDSFPAIPGWHVSAALWSARETSGDFYDIIALADDWLGLLVADVVDKGAGAALYMALSRTIIRTYALEHPRRPATALGEANRRILSDTRASQFVTVFYAALDPATGSMRYCNAGHNPPLLFSAEDPSCEQKLSRTGLPLGIFDDVSWEQGTVQLAPGDVVVLYSDGLTDAINVQDEAFGEERLLETIRANRGQPPRELKGAILAAVEGFVGDAPTFDDVTVLIVGRDPA